MINKNRIVPVSRTDLLTMVGVILGIANVSYTVAAASNVEGDFTISTTGNKLCNQPVRSINFTAVSGTVYFVAAYDYAGMSVNGTAVTPTGTVANDGATIYKAVLSSGAITITAVSPIAA